MRVKKREVEGAEEARGGKGDGRHRGRRKGRCGDVVGFGKKALRLEWRGPCGKMGAFNPPT